ncbi:hypothetical protein MLD38_022917 [Melastoma candidum]|uniref:Uncharacterized protein n=1 Tax=Melastoma candidum TaxID=119954 RepID=A0ACB9QNX2_9MYRT|nr:hypothetical protein MLD38_022917 [Melastoma candidum]
MLSNYMHHLLIKKLEMMSAVAGIGHIRYGDTCAEVQHFCRVYQAETVIEFCNKILNEDTNIELADMYKDKRTSVLSDACNLTRILTQKDNKWEIISGVRVELLTYAAGHCGPDKHARAVSEGGELVTIIWLLMAHFGIGPHFPYPED